MAKLTFQVKNHSYKVGHVVQIAYGGYYKIVSVLEDSVEVDPYSFKDRLFDKLFWFFCGD